MDSLSKKQSLLYQTVGNQGHQSNSAGERMDDSRVRPQKRRDGEQTARKGHRLEVSGVGLTTGLSLSLMSGQDNMRAMQLA